MAYVKKIYRSKTSRMIAGVCGGIAERIGIDPTIIRLVWAVLSFFLLFYGLGGIVLYIICALIIPLESDHIDV